ATPHDGLIRSAGFAVSTGTSGVPTVVPLLAGRDVARATDGTVDLAGAAMLLVERRAADDAGGFLHWGSADACAVDLCSRLNGNGGIVAVASGALGVDHRRVIDRHGLRQLFDETDPDWQELLERCGPALRRSAPDQRETPTSFTFAVAAPSPKVADRWGDWHLAEAMARALRSAGHPVTVRTQSELDDPAALCADVQVVVRGLAAVAPSPGRRQVLWVISHPEDLQIAECDRADLVLVASKLYADHLATLTSTPVGVLLQATDTERFRPAPTQSRRHDVVVVAKSRDVLRPMVTDALAAGLHPAIYGSGWDGLIDPSLIISDHIDNEDLPDLYGSAGVVLNDHWDTMRHWGFLSNRIFDVLACGTPVISDPIPGLQDHLGDLVPTWSTPAELATQTKSALALDRAAFADRARAEILRAHSFTHRAQELTTAMGAAGIPVHPNVPIRDR
ncbi:MAG: glycosyltransferase, partial [Acidimicrobiales bacterium]